MSDATRLISQHLNERAEEFAIHLLGNPTGRSARELRFFPKKGLSVKISGPYSGHWTDFGKSEGGDMLSLYMYVKKGASFADAINAAKVFLGISEGGDLPSIDIDKVRAENLKNAEKEEKKRIKIAQMIWSETLDLSLTSAPCYLRSRGITIDLAGQIRARRIPTSKLAFIGVEDASAFPAGLEALVCPATDANGEIRAVQQIFLDGGRKADVPVVKMTNGVMLGAAVRIGPTPRETLVLAEGPETGFSILQATGLPVWIVLGTSNFTRVEPPASVREIIIAADREESGAGLAGALEAASYWHSRGFRVGIADPREGDFNDALQAHGEEGLRTLFDEAAFPHVQGVSDMAIFTRAPDCAFVAWRATGAYVRAFPGGLRGSKTIVPEGIRRLVVVRDRHRSQDDVEDIALALKGWQASGAQVSILDLHADDLVTIAENAGYDSVARAIDLASPVRPSEPDAGDDRATRRAKSSQKTPDAKNLRWLVSPVGIASLATASATTPVLMVQRGDDVALCREVFGDNPALAPAAGEVNDFSSLKGREVILLADNSSKGLAWSARIILALRRAGCARTWILDWPTCRPGNGGYEFAYSKAPIGYGIRQFHADGWRVEHLDVIQQWLKTVDVVSVPTRRPRIHLEGA